MLHQLSPTPIHSSFYNKVLKEKNQLFMRFKLNDDGSLGFFKKGKKKKKLEVVKRRKNVSSKILKFNIFNNLEQRWQLKW